MTTRKLFIIGFGIGIILQGALSLGELKASAQAVAQARAQVAAAQREVEATQSDLDAARTSLTLLMQRKCHEPIQ